MIDQMLERAAAYAAKRVDRRAFIMGAVGLRSDGAIVCARNEAALDKEPLIHAEARLSRKLDVGSVVFVARVRSNGDWAIARPCDGCAKLLVSRGVGRIYFTVAPGEWGCIVL